MFRYYYYSTQGVAMQLNRQLVVQTCQGQCDESLSDGKDTIRPEY